MKFPDFQDDDEMAAWFEKNDVSAADLEVADDVTISSDLAIVTEVYSVRGPSSSSSNVAPTKAGIRKQDLSPVKA